MNIRRIHQGLRSMQNMPNEKLLQEYMARLNQWEEVLIQVEKCRAIPVKLLRDWVQIALQCPGIPTSLILYDCIHATLEAWPKEALRENSAF